MTHRPLADAPAEERARWRAELGAATEAAAHADRVLVVPYPGALATYDYGDGVVLTSCDRGSAHDEAARWSYRRSAEHAEAWAEAFPGVPWTSRRLQGHAKVEAPAAREGAGVFACKRCGPGFACTVEEVQNRSLDEPATVFVTCGKCLHRRRL